MTKGLRQEVRLLVGVPRVVILHYSALDLLLYEVMLCSNVLWLVSSACAADHHQGFLVVAADLDALSLLEHQPVMVATNYYTPDSR
jgi:hypothetical protein